MMSPESPRLSASRSVSQVPPLPACVQLLDVSDGASLAVCTVHTVGTLKVAVHCVFGVLVSLKAKATVAVLEALRQAPPQVTTWPAGTVAFSLTTAGSPA